MKRVLWIFAAGLAVSLLAGCASDASGVDDEATGRSVQRIEGGAAGAAGSSGLPHVAAAANMLSAPPAKLVLGTRSLGAGVFEFGLEPQARRLADFHDSDEVALGDLNGSGVDELVVGKANGSILVYNDAGQLVSFPNAATFSFRADDGLATGDVNADGFDEIVYAQPPLGQPSPGDAGRIYVITRQGVDVGDFFRSNQNSDNFPSFSRGSDVAVCDLDHDGFADVIRAPTWKIWSHPSRPQIALGSLFPAGLPAFSPGFDRIACADFNNDRFDDLVIVHATLPVGSPGAAVLQFFSVPGAAPVNFNPPARPAFTTGSDIAVGDLTGDGFAEMVVGYIPFGSNGNSSGVGALRVFNAAGEVSDFLPGSTSYLSGDSIAVGHLHFPRCTPLASNDITCDGIDNDCDGNVDEDFGTQTQTCGLGECRRTGTVVCVNAVLSTTCIPGLPTVDLPDQKDNDCDGAADNEVCDSNDNDGNLLIDDAAGSCQQRHLFIPNCWTGTQEAFQAAVTRWQNFWLRSADVEACAASQFVFEAAPVDASCEDMRTRATRVLDVVGGRHDHRQWDTISIVGPETPACAAGTSVGGGFLTLESGGLTPFTGEYMTFSHEWGHSWLEVRDEYSFIYNGVLDAMGAPNTVSPPDNPLLARLGCDPASRFSGNQDGCCNRDFPPICPNKPKADFCLGNLAQNLTDWEWGDPPAPNWGDGSRCIMSNASAPGTLTGDPVTGAGSHRGWCAACWANWEARKGPKCGNRFDGMQRRVSVLISTRAMAIVGGSPPSPEVGHYSIEVGRQGPPSLPSGGPTTFTLSTPSGSVLGRFAPRIESSGPDQSPTEVSSWVRIPVGNNVQLPLVLTTATAGSGSTKTTLGGRAPTAVLGSVTKECQAKTGTSVTLNGATSSDPDGDTVFYSWNSGGVALTPPDSGTPTGVFPVGTTSVTLTVKDGSNLASSATANVKVVDTKPPVIAALAPVSRATCESSALVNMGQPTAVDACASSVTVTGSVVVSNGVTLTTPIAVVGGQVRLGPGVHQIRWVASDGTQSAQATQTVTVGALVESGFSFVLDTRATLRAGSGFGPLFNAGTGIAQVGNDARTGDVLSVGPIDVGHRATVNGTARSAVSVTVAPDGSAPNKSVGPVSLPALPTLQNFSVPGGTGIVVTSTRVFAPGSYASITANGGSSVVFQGGDFFLGSLTVNSNVVLRAAPNTRIFVKSTLAFRSSFLNASNQIQPIFLGFAGTNATLEAAFNGTLLAPNASINFGLNTGLTFTGSFYAKTIWVRPDSTLVCIES